jgi:hypothetical protein
MERLARIEGQSRRLARQNRRLWTVGGAALGISKDEAPVVEIYGDDDSVIWKGP